LSLFVDTGVWSLALRRDAPPARPEVTALSQAIGSGDGPRFSPHRSALSVEAVEFLRLACGAVLRQFRR
jgi:hypothetical protein